MDTQSNPWDLSIRGPVSTHIIAATALIGLVRNICPQTRQEGSFRIAHQKTEYLYPTKEKWIMLCHCAVLKIESAALISVANKENDRP